LASPAWRRVAGASIRQGVEVSEHTEDGWTLATIKALVDERDVRYSQRFAAQQEALTAALSAAKEAVAAALLAADRAVTKAELASEKRFESVNEFRGALSDQTSKLIPRTEADQRFSAMEDKINLNTERLERMEGRGAGLGSAWQIILGIIAIIGTIAAVVYTVHALTGR
jgi:hypothetical protein